MTRVMDMYNVLWSETPYLVIDTETTGFGRDDRICEITAAVYFRGLRQAAFSALVDPGVPISSGSTEVHGIVDSDVRGRPRLRDVAGEIVSLMKTDVPWVAHNMSFDLRMLARDVPVELWPRGVPTLCTMSFARKHPPTRGMARHRVQDLARHFGVEVSTLHRSDADVALLAAVVPHLVGDAPVLSAMTKYSEDWVKEKSP